MEDNPSSIDGISPFRRKRLVCLATVATDASNRCGWRQPISVTASTILKTGSRNDSGTGISSPFLPRKRGATPPRYLLSLPHSSHSMVPYLAMNKLSFQSFGRSVSFRDATNGA